MIRTRACRGARSGLSRAGRWFVFALPGLWVLAVVAWELAHPAGTQLVQLLAAAPAIACAGSGRRQCVLFGGVCALFALLPLSAVEVQQDLVTRLGTCCAIVAVVGAGYLTTGRRLRLLRELERAREVAAATQRVLLRPLPQKLDGLALAAGHLSATRGASVGGDLYEALATRYGVRVVIGDVRGHGLAAIGAVAALLGSFREAAHDEPELAGVLRRLERAMHRHLRERSDEEYPAAGGAGSPPAEPGAEPDSPLAEEFATVLVLEVRECGNTVALNCGHPWPYLLTGEAAGGVRAVQVADAEPLPPLGPFPLPADLRVVDCAPLRPGQAFCLHTDGVEEARDAVGEFFPLPRELAAAAQAGDSSCDGSGAGTDSTGSGCCTGSSDTVSTGSSAVGPCPGPVPGTGPGIVPRTVVEGVHAALLRHTGGRLEDDTALVVLRNDRHRVPVPPAAAPACRARTLHSAAD
ncbi:PP2C family protein-serine/threonine phosphatase [Streptomyces sp. 7N604]|uniref:PP2C family protein-serine/threonine phosphatase n=1 Tax=Streptomyces sp. 7N604 TaxID=3457415 RepID=UPI003FD58CFD